MRVSLLAAVLACAQNSVLALSPAEWRGQSIYQIVTDRFARSDETAPSCDPNLGVYCGGDWQGIIGKLDYIQGMGFTAIWISPVVTNLEGNSLDGEAYHGYWAQDIYSINSHFGTAADLKDLSTALHNRGMYLMVDVVTNHMGYRGSANSVDYSVFNPFNKQSEYHPVCFIDYDSNNQTNLKQCWEGDNIVALPDLRTEDTSVADVWNSWITGLVTNYSIDGLRIDSAQQVNNDFFPPFQSAAGVHVLGEVLNGNPTYVCPYQESMSGVLNYPQFFWVTQAFESTSGSISNLVNGINTMKSTCSDTTLLGQFLENHDNPRFPNMTSDISLTKNAIAFTVLSDGSPIIYYGQEQHYSGGVVPFDREALWSSGYSTTSTFYTWIAALNQIRNQAVYKDTGYVTYKAYPIYSDDTTIAMRKGDTGYQIISVFSNLGASAASYTLNLASSATGFTANQDLVEVMSCTSYTTDSSSNLAVKMANGLPRVFYPKAQLTGSGICTSITGSTSSTTSAAGSTISKTTSTTTVKSASSKVTSTTKAATTSTKATSSKTTSTASSSKSTSCTLPTSVAVIFKEVVTTSYGQTIKLVGNNSALGNWATANAVALSSSQYTSSNPLWTGTVSFAPGTVIVYKYINVASDGTPTWEADPNHTFTVPSSCATTAATVSNTWQS